MTTTAPWGRTSARAWTSERKGSSMPDSICTGIPVSKRAWVKRSLAVNSASDPNAPGLALWASG